MISSQQLTANPAQNQSEYQDRHLTSTTIDGSNFEGLKIPKTDRQKRTDFNQIADIAKDIRNVIGLRHAFARHNELGIFNGNPEFKDKYGLVSRGIQEIKDQIPKLRAWALQGDLPVVIITSDFLRAVQSGQIIAEGLGQIVTSLEHRQELRERNPGVLEGLAYQKILSRLGIETEHKHRKDHGAKSKEEQAMKLPWICKSGLLAKSSKDLLKMETNTAVIERTTSLLRETHFRQQLDPCKVILIGHEFSLGPLLSAFLQSTDRIPWTPALYWINRHIPRAHPFSMSVRSAEKHYLDKSSLQISYA